MYADVTPIASYSSAIASVHCGELDKRSVNNSVRQSFDLGRRIFAITLYATFNSSLYSVCPQSLPCSTHPCADLETSLSSSYLKRNI